MAVAFDTLVAARRKEAAGVERGEAEAVAAVAREAAGSAAVDCADPAAKAGIKAALETGLTWRFFGAMAAQGAPIAAAVELLS